MKNNTVLYLTKGDTALLKRRAIADYFGNAILNIENSGKPVIAYPKGFGVSFSHSGGIVTAVISPFDIGIDIEERKQRNTKRLRSFFHESETDDFYNLWTKKEAWGKLTGNGIFSQKGKKLPDDINFLDISEIVSRFAEAEFSAHIASVEGMELAEVIII